MWLTFVFNFFPKEHSEAEEVKGLIQDLQDGSTPRLVGVTGANTSRITAPFFASPRQWNIKFCKGYTSSIMAAGGAGGTGARDFSPRQGAQNQYLLKINRSVITTMTVNQDPQSIVGFHPDGSPVQTQLSITFKELEYVTSNDKTSKSRSMQEASLHNEQKANAAAILATKQWMANSGGNITKDQIRFGKGPL